MALAGVERPCRSIQRSVAFVGSTHVTTGRVDQEASAREREVRIPIRSVGKRIAHHFDRPSGHLETFHVERDGENAPERA